MQKNTLEREIKILKDYVLSFVIQALQEDDLRKIGRTEKKENTGLYLQILKGLKLR